MTAAKPETTLYASDNSEASVTEAREYIAQHGLTQDDVRFIKKGDYVLVVAKRELWK